MVFRVCFHSCDTIRPDSILVGDLTTPAFFPAPTFKRPGVFKPPQRNASSVLLILHSTLGNSRYDGLRYGHSASAETLSSIPNSTEAHFARARAEGFNSVVRGRILAGNYFLLRSQVGRHLEAARRLWRLIKQDFDDVST